MESTKSEKPMVWPGVTGLEYLFQNNTRTHYEAPPYPRRRPSTQLAYMTKLMMMVTTLRQDFTTSATVAPKRLMSNNTKATLA